ncbi:MAG: trigger factor, partial [Mycoplasma sp.]
FDFVGSVDGVEFPGGKAENYELEIGSGQFIPGFEEQMIGLNVGDEKELNVTFPKEYHSEDLAGKDSIFKVKIHEINSISKPKLDDAFVKSLKIEDDKIKTPKDLKELIEKSLLSEKNRELTQSNLSIINEAIVKNAKYDEIPQIIIDEEKKELKRNFMERITQMNFKFDDFLKMTGQSQEEFENQMDESAKTSIIVQSAIEYIGDKEKITADESKIEEQYKLIADAHNKSIEEIKKAIDLETLKLAIQREEVITKLMEWNSKK